MPANTDSISVIIPCRNYRRFLADCLQSILGQTRPPDEVIVVDDGSEDAPGEIVGRFADPRVSYHYVNFGNLVQARRFGLQQSRGSVLCFVDADDALSPFYLEQGIAMFAEDYRIAIVYSDLEYFGLMSGRTNFPPDSLQANIERQNFIHAGSLVRRDAMVFSGALDHPPLDTYLEDWFCWKKILRRGFCAVKQPETYCYRRHGNSLTVTRYWGPAVPYFRQAALDAEEVAIAVVLRRPERSWPQLLRFLRNQRWPRELCHLHLLIAADNCSEINGFREALLAENYPNISVSELRDPHSKAAHLQQAAEGTASPFVLYLDEEVEPPDDVIESLLRCYCESTVSVSAWFPSLDGHAPIALAEGGQPFAERSGTHRVQSNYLGCALLRTQEFAAAAALLDREGAENAPEIELYRLLGETGISKLNAEAICRLPAAESALPAAQSNGCAAVDAAGAHESAVVTADTFDNDRYLTRYPDVARAVNDGRFVDGYQHYCLHGRGEGRQAPLRAVRFDEAFYLRANPDVREAVNRGEFRSGYEHYCNCGERERRPAHFY